MEKSNELLYKSKIIYTAAQKAAVFAGVSDIKAFRVITVILLIIWMSLIFSLSSQNADTSSKTSGGLIRATLSVFYPDFEELTKENQEEIVGSFQFLARKTAHFSLYAVLGGLSFLSVISYRKLMLKIRVLSASVICLIYAVSDEVHQIFIPGRSGEVRDVLIDFCGAFITIIILTLFSRYIKGIYKHISTVQPNK